MRVCGSGDVRRRRLPCRSDTAAGWPAALPLGHATTFAAARWRRAHRGPRRGTRSCRYRCRSRRSQYWVSETWRAPCLWRPLPASVAGGAGARPDHPITGPYMRLKQEPARMRGRASDPLDRWPRSSSPFSTGGRRWRADHRRDLGDLVKAAFELGKDLQRLGIGKWQELHEDDAGDVLGRIDPEIGVGEAGPGEAAGAPARQRSLGVDHEAESPFLDHAREEFGVER